MTAEILENRDLEMYIASWRLIPASKGVFEVMVNGELVFSKKALKRLPLPGEIYSAILQKLDEARPNRPPKIPLVD